MHPKLLARIFDFSVEPGRMPEVLNPRPGVPFRSLSYGPAGWRLTTETYGMVARPELFQVDDVRKAVEAFEPLLKSSPSFYVVYSVSRGDDGDRVCAVAFRLPSLPGYVPSVPDHRGRV